MELFEEYKLYEDLWEADKKVAGTRDAAVTDADFQWDEATIVDDFKRAAIAYTNGANLEDALRDIKIMIINNKQEIYIIVKMCRFIFSFVK